MVKVVVKLEGLAVFLSSLYCYGILEASWAYFVLFWLFPDLSLLGYLKNHQWGAVIYNAVHNYILALVVIVFGLWTNDFIVSLGVILASHIGLDRFLGFGLKYPAGRKQTHIQKL